MGRSFEEDPLTLAMAPPPDETLEQRHVREQAEAEARRVSDEIDEQIRREKEMERKKKKPVKLLLLGEQQVTSFCSRFPEPPKGQSESGKTATLKSI